MRAKANSPNTVPLSTFDIHCRLLKQHCSLIHAPGCLLPTSCTFPGKKIFFLWDNISWGLDVGYIVNEFTYSATIVPSIN